MVMSNEEILIVNDEDDNFFFICRYIRSGNISALFGFRKGSVDNIRCKEFNLLYGTNPS